jgi:aromatic ring hydroxylase
VVQDDGGNCSVCQTGRHRGPSLRTNVDASLSVLGVLKLLEEMHGKGCQPNERTYSTLLMGLCKNKKLDKAVEV